MPYGLTTNKVSSTYTRLVQYISGSYYDGYGNLLNTNTSSIDTTVLATTGSNIFNGDQIISGSLYVTNGITASVSDTASWALQSLSSSYSLSSSFAISASQADTSYNGNRSIKRSGYIGINVGGTTLQQFVENFFFPFIPATVAIASSGTTYYETGSTQTFSIASSITANDETTFGSSSIKRDSAVWNTTGSSILGTPLSFTFADSISSSHTYQTFVQTDNNGSPIVINSSTKTATFIYPYLYGTSAIPDLSGTALYTGLSGKSITTQGTKTFNYNSSVVYMYFCYPASYDDITSIKDPNLLQVFNSIGYSGSVPVTSSGLTNNWSLLYKVYRTKLVASMNGNFIFS